MMDASGPPTTPSCSPGLFLPPEASTPVVATPEVAISSGLQEASDMNIDDSIEGISETEKVERFTNNSCGCKYGPNGSPCSSFFDKGYHRTV